jgi:hypothetical protein
LSQSSLAGGVDWTVLSAFPSSWKTPVSCTAIEGCSTPKRRATAPTPTATRAARRCLCERVVKMRMRCAPFPWVSRAPRSASRQGEMRAPERHECGVPPPPANMLRPVELRKPSIAFGATAHGDSFGIHKKGAAPSLAVRKTVQSPHPLSSDQYSGYSSVAVCDSGRRAATGAGCDRARRETGTTIVGLRVSTRVGPGRVVAS